MADNDADQNRARAAAGGGARIDDPKREESRAAAFNDWRDAALKDLQGWFDRHVANSPAAQRTDIYNALHGARETIRSTLSNL